MVDFVVGTVTVPDVVGVDEASASSTCDAQQIIPVIVRVYRPDVEPGIVLSQSIAPGTEVQPNTTIRLVVASSDRKRNMVTTRRTLLRVIRS